MFVFETKIHHDASDYEGTNVRVMVLVEGPVIDTTITSIHLWRGDVKPLSLEEEQFASLFPDGQDVMNNAMEAAVCEFSDLN